MGTYYLREMFLEMTCFLMVISLSIDSIKLFGTILGCLESVRKKIWQHKDAN